MQPQSVIPLPLNGHWSSAGQPGRDDRAHADTGRQAWEEMIERLSRREREVLQELVDGHSFAQAASNLYVSRHTFRTHAKNILAKLGVHSSLEAVSVGARAGMRPRVG